MLSQFVRKFTDAFGRRQRPSIVILREVVPKAFVTVDAVASVRHLVAKSVVHLHHLGRARGTSHVAVSIARGQQLMRALRGHLSGLCPA